MDEVCTGEVRQRKGNEAQVRVHQQVYIIWLVYEEPDAYMSKKLATNTVEISKPQN